MPVIEVLIATNLPAPYRRSGMHELRLFFCPIQFVHTVCSCRYSTYDTTFWGRGHHVHSALKRARHGFAVGSVPNDLSVFVSVQRNFGWYNLSALMMRTNLRNKCPSSSSKKNEHLHTCIYSLNNTLPSHTPASRLFAERTV